MKQSWWAFRDFAVPAGYVPFNVQALDNRIFVAYARVNKKTGRSVAGHGLGYGLGYVDEYTTEGKFVARVASRGDLNAPWALTQATATTGGTDALWFSTGPDQETHGLIGLLRKP